MINYLIYIVSFFVFLRVFFKGAKLISAIHGFIIFFLVQFGPHTIFYQNSCCSSFSHLSNPQASHYVYIQAISVFQIAISFFYLTFNNRLSKFFDKIFHFDRIYVGRTKKMTLFLLITAFLLLSVSLILQASNNFSITNLKFLMGQSLLSYTFVRRELFEDARIALFIASTRFTLAPFLLGMFMINLRVFPIKPKSKKWLFRTVAWILIAFFIFLYLQIQLSKLIYIYDLLFIVLLSFFLVTNIRVITLTQLVTFKNFKNLFSILAIGAIALIATYYLYTFQYENVSLVFDKADISIVNVLVHRAFYASSDAMTMWIDYFSDNNFFGLSVNPKLSAAFDLNYINTTKVIPQYYFGNSWSSSFQPGSIASGYAMFGMFGVILSGFVIALVLIFSSVVQLAYLDSPYYGVVAAQLILSAYFFTSSELIVALLSGGCLFIPVLYFVAIIVCGKKKIC